LIDIPVGLLQHFRQIFASEQPDMSYFYLVNQESIQHFEIEFTDVANAVEHDYMIVNV